MIRVYNNAMVRHQARYYEDSGFFNFGYWGGNAKSQREASEALVDQLLARIAIKGGRILDVACGVGASTRRLIDSYAPNMISAINISDVQLVEARKRVPQCTFIQMDAAHLDFPSDYFDAVICVEAAFHFETREAFLRETFRVLKPGGSLVLSDILFRTFAAPFVNFFHVPRANRLSHIATYRNQLEAIGFGEVGVQDATDVCLRHFCRHLSGWPTCQPKAGHLKLGKAIRRSISYRALASFIAASCKFYLLVACRKPPLPGLTKPTASLGID